MTTFYIEKENKIMLFDTDKARLTRTLKIMPQYKELKIQETDRPIENFEWADTPEYIAKKSKQDLENSLTSKEAQTGLIRPMREMILAENSGASDYVKAKAQELEYLAEALRKKETNQD